MKTYVALLRGINVGGHRKIKMVDLKAMFNTMGFENVRTYIQSGNIVFQSKKTDCYKIAKTISEQIAVTYSFEVPVLIKIYNEFKAIVDNNPFTEPTDIEDKKIYFALLKESPKLELIAAFREEKFTNEYFSITANCVYLKYNLGAGKAKLSNNLIERKLKVSATSRNYRTMVKLLEMSAAIK